MDYMVAAAATGIYPGEAVHYRLVGMWRVDYCCTARVTTWVVLFELHQVEDRMEGWQIPGSFPRNWRGRVPGFH